MHAQLTRSITRTRVRVPRLAIHTRHLTCSFPLSSLSTSTLVSCHFNNAAWFSFVIKQVGYNRSSKKDAWHLKVMVHYFSQPDNDKANTSNWLKGSTAEMIQRWGSTNNEVRVWHLKLIGALRKIFIENFLSKTGILMNQSHFNWYQVPDTLKVQHVHMNATTVRPYPCWYSGVVVVRLDPFQKCIENQSLQRHSHCHFIWMTTITTCKKIQKET